MTRKWTEADSKMRAAAMHRKWQDVLRLSSRKPYYIELMAVRDNRTQPYCMTLHGIIVRYDHPWLQSHLPPHSDTCRCTFAALSELHMQRKNILVTPDKNLPD